MSSLQLGIIVFVLVFASAFFGLWLSRVLPPHRRDSHTQDTIKLGIGMISVLASLVLGLLTASVKSAFDTTNSEIRSFAADLILLNDTLVGYGSGTAPARALLREYTARAIQDQWPDEATAKVKTDDKDAGKLLEQVRREILGLPANTPETGGLRSSALSLVETLLQTRSLLIAHSGSSIQPVFLWVLICWIMLIFASFGFNAPFNAMVTATFFTCAVALGSSLFLISEMDGPFDGVIRISSEAMRIALSHMTG
ncbi:MAG: DUF4239 domain-containing protein [Rhodospirillales bacterium]|nr:DUF4239 domain-containing protein [Rhodospirillales bacterium]